jgi:hypothetical protein
VIPVARQGERKEPGEINRQIGETLEGGDVLRWRHARTIAARCLPIQGGAVARESHDSTIADLHYTLQIAMGWTDSHLHRFQIYGREFGVYQSGGPIFDAPAEKVRLADFCFRLRERFLYE